jgi:hypothetical protein
MVLARFSFRPVHASKAKKAFLMPGICFAMSAAPALVSSQKSLTSTFEKEERKW